MIDPQQRKAVKQARHRHVRDSLEAFASGNLAEAKHHQEAAELAGKILAASERDRSALWAVGIASVSVALILLGLTFRVRTTPVTLELQVDGFVSQLVDSVRIVDELDATGVVLDGLDSATLDYEPLDVPDALLEVSGPQVRIRSIDVEGNAALETEGRGGTLDLFVRGGQVTVRLAARQAVLEVEGVEPSVFQIAQSPEDPQVAIDGLADVAAESVLPARMTLELGDDWELPPLRVTGLALTAESPAGSGRFLSTVRGGTMTIHESGKVVSVARGDSVAVAFRRPAQAILAGGESGLHLLMRGMACQIASGGPDEQLRNHRPTWLEFLYHDQRLAVLWTGAVFLWGFLWSVKRTFWP